MLRPGLIFARGPATIAVMPIADASNDPLVAQMAANVSGRLTDGLAKIENIRSAGVGKQPHRRPTSW